MFLTWGVKPFKQFHIIITKSKAKNTKTNSTQFYQSIHIRTSIGPSNTTIS